MGVLSGATEKLCNHREAARQSQAVRAEKEKELSAVLAGPSSHNATVGSDRTVWEQAFKVFAGRHGVGSAQPARHDKRHGLLDLHLGSAKSECCAV